MKSIKIPVKSVDMYISEFPKEIQLRLEEILIKKMIKFRLLLLETEFKLKSIKKK